MTGQAALTGLTKSILGRTVRSFDRYVQAAAFRSFIQVIAALTALFSLLEFVEQLSTVGQGTYRVSDALLYVLLRVPSRAVQVTPVSMLLGSLWALGSLARESELIALRSLGVSENRIIGSVVMLVLPIVTVVFLLSQFVIPPAQQLAQAIHAAAVTASSAETSFWAEDDHQYLNVGEFTDATVARDIDIYAFQADGSIDSFIHADRADIQADDIWMLSGVARKRGVVLGLETEHLASLPWKSFVSDREVKLLALPVENMPPIGLYRYINDLKQHDQQPIRFEQELWRKFSIPFSMIAMIVTAAPFVFGSPRRQSIGRQIMIGAIFGIVFSLIQQIAGHLDLLLGLNPAVTALAPSLLLIGLAAYLLRRAHR